jgi:hypothetical protein
LSKRTANTNVDWQQRATEFSVGDRVVPYGHGDDLAGRVSAVWAAIGMVDVEFPHGSKRYGVEDLQRLDSDGVPFTPETSTVPAGPGTVSVPGGPHPKTAQTASIERIARAFVKKSLYWAAKDRQYRATRPEADTGHYCCPKCKRQGVKTILKPAAYKRRDGQSERLLGCPGCLFLIKKSDILNDPASAVVVEVTV